MRFSEEFIEELNRRNDIESVVSSYVTLRRAGSNLKGLCPFHNEKTPSFTLYPQNNSYYCFGCGAGGDVITFVRQIEHLDYLEAVKFLTDRAGMRLPENEIDDSMLQFRRRILEINRMAARFFHHTLVSPQGRTVLAYLQQRGLRMETVKHFGLGYAPNAWESLYQYLKSEGFTKQELIQANLVGENKNGKLYDRFRNRVMFPIIDLRGNVIAFGGRIMPGEQGAKYVNSSDTPVFKKSRNLYAMNFAKSSGSPDFLLAEGYMDVIALHQAGFTNAVAALGTAFTGEQAKLMARYKSAVTLTLDADAAGQRATVRAMEILSKTGLHVKVVRIPDGKDPDEYIKVHGKEKFRILIEGAGNDIEYRLQELRSKHDVNTDNGKLQYLNEAVEVLSRVEDSIARELYAGKLSEEFGVAKNVLLQRVGKAYQKRKGIQQKRNFQKITLPKNKDTINPEALKYPRAANAEAELLSILMNHPDWVLYAGENLETTQLITSFHTRVYQALLELFENGYSFDPSYLSEAFTSDEMGRIIYIGSRFLGQKNVKNACNDCIRVILEEKEKLTRKAASDMSTDEWAESLKKLRDKQRGV